MPKGWSAKDERMARHIMESGEPKSIAMATVNKYRKSKKRKR